MGRKIERLLRYRPLFVMGNLLWGVHCHGLQCRAQNGVGSATIVDRESKQPGRDRAHGAARAHRAARASPAAGWVGGEQAVTGSLAERGAPIPIHPPLRLERAAALRPG